MGAPVTIVEKSPQAMRRLYLGSPQRRRLCGVRRSDGVNERRRLLKKRKRRRERYAVRDDVSRGNKKDAVGFLSFGLEPTQSQHSLISFNVYISKDCICGINDFAFL